MNGTDAHEDAEDLREYLALTQADREREQWLTVRAMSRWMRKADARIAAIEKNGSLAVWMGRLAAATAWAVPVITLLVIWLRGG